MFLNLLRRQKSVYPSLKRIKMILMSVLKHWKKQYPMPKSKKAKRKKPLARVIGDAES